jgi:hypothetical protein
MIKMLLSKYGQSKPIDFLVYIGDETLNEPGFKILNELKKSNKLK